MNKMDKKTIGVAIALFFSFAANAQRFNFTCNGVTVTYEIISIPKHEVKVKYVPKNVTAVTIPAVVHFNKESFKVTEISDGSCTGGGGLFSSCDDYYSFKNCKLLKTVVLPNTIRKIGEESFEDCVWLRRINLPSGLKKIGNEAFRGCESLNLSSIELPSSLKSLGDNERWGWGINGNIFYGCSGTLYIPANIDTIGYEALYGSDFRLSEQIGVVLEDRIILNKGFKIADGFGHKYKKGKKIIDSEAFGKYKITSMDAFEGIVVQSPSYYLKISKGTALESTVKEILVTNGNYEDILAIYPNDTEVQEFQKKAKIKSLMILGDVESKNKNYSAAKQIYEQILSLSPDNIEAKNKIAKIDATIAEQERLRKEAEEKARREAEETSVRVYVAGNIQLAKKLASRGNLQAAVGCLQRAIDTADAHQYNYRLSEMTQIIDSIVLVQAIIADTSKTFSYEDFRSDLYHETKYALSARIKHLLAEADNAVERNHVSFTLFTDNRDGAFNLRETSRALKNICRNTMDDVKLQPLVVDNIPLKASATFDFDFEYAKGTIKVEQDNSRPTINSNLKMSPALEANMTKTLSNQLKSLPNTCDGKYKFKVSSMDVNGGMEHRFELKDCSFRNGPQNAWKSMLVPGWGDKYVEEDGKFDLWTTLFSYGLIGIGIPYILDDGMITKTSSSPRQDPNINPIYPYYVFDENGYKIYDTIYTIPKRTIGFIFAACGAAIWIYDVIQVYVKGSRNKKKNNECLGGFSFAYDPKNKVPELVYSLSF